MRGISKIVILGYLLLLFFLCTSVTLASGSDWLQYQHDLQHTGSNSIESSLKPPLTEIWKTSINSSDFIIISGNTLYTTDLYHVYSINTSNGSINWQRPIDGGKNLVLSKNILYVGENAGVCNNNCHLFAFNASTGEQIWSTPTPDAVFIAVDDSTILVGSNQHSIQAYNTSGEHIWTTNTNDGATSIPTVNDGIVYSGTFQGSFYALNEANGQILWTNDSASCSNSGSVIHNGTIYTGSRCGGGIFAMDAFSGKIIFHVLLGVSITSSVAFSDNILYAQADSGEVYAINSSNGDLVWDSTIPQGNLGGDGYLAGANPVVANGVVYVGSSNPDNKIYAFNAANGTKIWDYQMQGPVGTPIVAYSKLFVPSHDGNIYAFTNPSLNVPYFSQNASPWGQTEYDNAKQLGFADPTMDRWGCAVTSAAMVLNFHGITKLANGDALNPGSLNTWLKNNHGYLEGTGSGGTYSYLLWPRVASLTKQIFNAGKSDTELMYQRLYPGNNTTKTVDNDVTTDTPDILSVANAKTSMHFVVAKGKKSNTYLINDPEWNYPDLMSFSNTYTQVDRFMPSHTDLSYLVAVVNPDISISIASPSGEKIGTDTMDGGNLASFSGILNATYGFEAPISNPDSNDSPERLGTGVNVIYIPLPTNGIYTINLSGTKNKFYTLNLASFQMDGTETVSTIQGTVDSKNPDTFTAYYTDTGEPKVAQEVTFDSLLADITQLKSLGFLNKNIAKALTREVKSITKSNKKARTRKTVLVELTAFEFTIATIRKSNPQLIAEFAYQELYRDAETLKTNQ